MGKQTHIASLDGVRGLAAFMVVLCHLKMMLPGAPIPLAIEIGSEAVALFFTLSGFLMAILYAHAPLTLESGAQFLVSRFARIYPVYLFAILLVILLSAIPSLEYFQPIHGFGQIVRHLAMVGSSGMFWSIGPEVQFYLLFLLLWYGMANRMRLQILLPVLLGLVAMAGTLDFPGPGILVTSKFYFFLGGVIAGHLHHRFPMERPLLLHGLLALALTLYLFGYQTMAPAFAKPDWGLATALLAAVIVLTAAKEHSLSAAFFAAAPLRFLGEISFSLYLLHNIVGFLFLQMTKGALPDGVLVWIILALDVLVAVAANRLIEKPCRRGIVGFWLRKGAPVLARLDRSGIRKRITFPSLAPRP